MTSEDAIESLKQGPVLVTGTAGFIGFHVARRLLEAGCQVVGFDNVNAYYDVRLKEDRLAQLRQHPNFSFIKGDLADQQSVAQVFAQAKPLHHRATCRHQEPAHRCFPRLASTKSPTLHSPDHLPQERSGGPGLYGLRLHDCAISVRQG
jgi:hypothetical protein